MEVTLLGLRTMGSYEFRVNQGELGATQIER